MATKNLAGPLAIASTPEEAASYNATMKDLMGQLVQSPEDVAKDEMLAWSGGLGTGADGSGTAGALGRAAKAQSDYRQADRTLRAQYIPLIMNAVAAQQAAGIQQRLMAGLGTKPIADMSLEDVNMLENFGGQKGLMEKWKAAKQGLELKTGWNVDANGKRFFVPDPSKNVGYDEEGNVINLPGAVKAAGELAGSQERAKLDAQTDYEMVPGQDAAGTPILVAKRKALAQAGAPPSVTGGVAAPSPAAPPVRTAGAGPAAQPAVRGAFEGPPEKVLADIATIKDPAARRQAQTAYANQMAGQNPDFVPEGGAPAQQPASQAPAAEGGTGFVTGRSPIQKTADENVGKGNDVWLKESYTPALAAGSAATGMLDNLNTARLGLKKIGDGTGWTAEAQKKGAEILGALGVQNAADKATGYQQFQQAAMTQVNSVLNLAKGPQTDQDARRAQETFVSLGKTPQANQFLIDYAQAVAERDKRRADFYRQAYPIASKQGDLTAVDRSWARVDRSIWESDAMRRWNKQLKGK